MFATEDNPHAWDTSWKNFMPRVGVNYRIGDDAVVRFAYARFMMPISNVRDTLGDFVNQYAGLRADDHDARSVQRAAAADAGRSRSRPTTRCRSRTGRRSAATPDLGGAVSSTSTSCARRSTTASTCRSRSRLWAGLVMDASYFFNYGSRVPYTLNLNMMDPAFTYEQETPLNTQVANPFRNYLTPQTFPGRCATTPPSRWAAC